MAEILVPQTKERAAVKGRTKLVTTVAAIVLLAFAPTFVAMARQAKSPAPGAQETYIYTVKKGDTLWDICEQLYDNPWVWPKLWQLNPQISNPHWIYPGTKLEVYYQVPKPVAVAPAVKAPAPPPPAPAVTFEEMNQVGFITPFRPVGLGVIVGEKNQKVLIGMGDEVYAQFRRPYKPALGDRYTIFRTSDLILHPITHKKVGYLNSIKGVLEVVEVAPNHVRAMVLRSYQAIASGDKLMPYKERSEKIVLHPATSPRQGYIVLAGGRRYLIGDHQIVFVDLGENEGIQPGNLFEVFREPKATSLLRRESELVLTAQPIGELLVLSVQKETAAALVTRAKSEFIPGERVRLKMQH